MILMDEMYPLRLYSSKLKAYVPFNPANKKKGSAITLLSNSLQNSIDMMNLPYVYNPNYYVSYYMNRDVNAYLTKNGKVSIADEEEEVDPAIVEAVLHMAKRNAPKVEAVDGTPNDNRKLEILFDKKVFEKWYRYFKVRDSKRVFPSVYGFNSLPDMANAINDKAIMDHGNMITNSYNSSEEIFVLNPSAYIGSRFEKSDGPYEMYCESAIITYIVNNCFPKATWYLANQVGAALSGQADWLYKDNDYHVSDNLNAAIMISNLRYKYGDAEVLDLVKTGSYTKLAKLGAHDFLKRVTPLYSNESAIHEGNTIVIHELANISDDKIAVGTDFHFIGYNDDQTKIVMKPKSYIEKIIEKEQEIAGDDGIFIFLGDMLYKGFHTPYEIPDKMKKDAISYIKSFTGKYKIFVRGNHDVLPDDFYLNDLGFTHIGSSLLYNDYLFTHQPEMVRPPLINIHGHIHGKRQYYEKHPSRHMDVFTMNGSHIGRLTDIIKKQEDYDKTTKQVSNPDKGDPHHYIMGDPLDLNDIVNEFGIENIDLYPIVEIGLDQSIKTDRDLSNWMKRNISYSNMTSLKTPDELLSSKTGSCHDQVAFEMSALKKLGYHPSAWLVFEYNESGQSGETHSYVTYKKDGKLYWFENAWGGKEGIHEISSTKFIEDMHKSGSWGDINKYPNIEITKFKINYGDSLQELIDRSTIDESVISESDGTHGDVIRVYKAMNDTDREYIDPTDGYETIDARSVCYRHIERDGLFGIKGFIECFYDLGEVASVVIGVHPKYRNQGIATALMDKLFKEFPKENPDINELIWRCDSKNSKSAKLAEKYGFTLVRKSSIQKVYRYEFKPSHKYDDIPSDILNESDLTKWSKKNITIDDSYVTRKDKVMSIKDIKSTKKVKQIDAAYFWYRAIKKMGLNASFVVALEYDNSIKTNIGNLYGVVLYWYNPDEVLIYNPLDKDHIKRMVNSDVFFDYLNKLHDDYVWGDVDRYPGIGYYIPFDDVQLKEKALWYDDVIDIKTLAKNLKIDPYAIHELTTKSEVIPSYDSGKMPRNLQSFKKIKLDDKVIAKYEKQMSGLSHVKTTNRCTGYLFINKYDQPVCYYNTERKPDKEGTYGEDIVWLQAIEVADEYKGTSLSKQLIQMAVANDHVTNLAVNKDNAVAYKVYASMGFKQYLVNGQMIYMQIPSHKEEFVIPDSTGVMKLDEQVYVFDEVGAQFSYDTRIKKYLYKSRLRRSTDQISIYNQVKGMCPVIKKTFVNPSAYRGYNLFVDLSYYNEIFLRNNTTVRDVAIQFYWDFVNRLIDKNTEFLSQYGYSKNTLFIPVWSNAWPTKENTYVYDWKENLNPISMIFRMLRKNPDELRNKWGKMDIIFLGQTGYFKVDFSKFDRKDLNKFKIRLEKLYRGENIEKDPDEDGYTYGQNADVSDSDSSAAIAVKLVDKIEASSGITVDNVSKAVSVSDDSMVKIDGSVIYPNMRIRSSKIPVNIDGCSIGIMTPSEDDIINTIGSQIIDYKTVQPDTIYSK